MRRFFQRHGFSLAILAVCTAAYLRPGFFLEVAGHSTAVLISPLIQLIMFGMGTTLRKADFLNVVRRPLPVALGVVLQFSVMPLTGFGLACAFGLDGDVAAGVVLIGSAAGGVASNVIAYIAGANVALSVSMTAVSTLLSPLLTPLLMRGLAGRFIPIDAGAMALSLVKMIVLPLVASQIARWAFDRWCRRVNVVIDRVLPYVSIAAICVIMSVCVSQAHEILWTAGAVVFVIAVLHNSTGYLLGYWGARLAGRFCAVDERDCRTVAIEVGMQNAGMSQALAVDVLKCAGAALAPAIFGVWMDFSGSILANWWRRRPVEGQEKE